MSGLVLALWGVVVAAGFGHPVRAGFSAGLGGGQVGVEEVEDETAEATEVPWLSFLPIDQRAATGSAKLCGKEVEVSNSERPLFGPIDPYALLPSVALASFGFVLLLNGVVLVGLVPLVLAGLIIAFDSWANRSERRRRR
ncbi:hypothetical protein [Kibdelosporangium aridum]|uniref:Uncharacterized protein n=1 Tax=Kibdelosporangium aridum TaxID=2030 RepID=A0A1W2B7G7_KIBAR|nr:hypothetical protein [Kibdelosporangium aridum]SMC68879.1 hypothetical protein SAMN05661093_01446 [Kibdelosporangium aridum]